MKRAKKVEGGKGVNRRTFLKMAGVAAGATVAGGIPGILVAQKAPAYPKGTKLHMLQWINFVPDGDKVFLAQAEEFGKQMGVEVYVERIGMNDVRAKVTASIEAKSGPDLALIYNNYAHLYREALVDVSDIAEAIGKQQGGYYEFAKSNCFSGGRWMAVPQFVFSWAWNYREDWFKEEGITKFPETWDEFREVGKKLKAKGRPVGQAFGHSENDPNNYCYALMWCFGGMEVEKDGKTVIVDKKGTLEAIKFNTACWKDCFDEGGLTWDDSSNNRAFLAGSLSITGNGPSIYIVARTKFPDIYKAMNHAPTPRGPAGRFYQLTALNAAVFKYSKNQKLAREFIRWFMDKKQYGEWFHVMDTYAIPGTKEWYNDPIWEKDPKCTVMRDVIKDARVIGYAGAPGKKATEAFAKYIVVDMFAKAIQGASPEEALKWAAVEMRKVYS